MRSPIAEDPRLAAILAITSELTSPGQPFETFDELVLGERVSVFKNRPRSLRQVLVEGASFGTEDAYIFDDGSRVSFVDLPRQVAAVAAHLRDHYGIGPGDRVAICAANCVEWLFVFWAAASMNAIVVAMNGWWTATEMRNAIELTEPSLLLMDEKRAARLEGDVSVPVVIFERDFAPFLNLQDAPLPDTEIAEDDPLIVVFTSGTTGSPKAAVLSHRSVIGHLKLRTFLAARGAMLAGHSELSGPGPTQLAPFPLFHVAGIGLAVGTVMIGTKTVWPLGRFDPAKVIDVTLRENIGVWIGGMTHIARLLACPEIDRLPRSQLVALGVGGSATTPGVIRKAEERFPHATATMSSGYGSTETGGVSTWAANWMLRVVPNCVGLALPTVQVRITNDLGEVVPAGVEGNIEIRSPYTMLGYWRNDVANAEIIRDGRWVASGDFGCIEDGLLSIASRRRDLIIRGGENIYPFEIENRLEEHPAVIEAAVFGVDDPVHGQVVKAVVVVPRGTVLSEAKLRAFCAETLASYKVPDHLEVRAERLPRNATGKVMKHVLSGAAANSFAEDEG
jgi:acyl-CoA synthetase (AMP-forming)/AMP-acid ligase II